MQLCRCQLQGGQGPLAEAGAASAGLLTCRRYALVSPICHQEKEFEEVSRLHSSSDNEKNKKTINQVFSKTLQIQEPEPPPVPKEGQTGSVLFALENGDFW